MGDGTLIIGLAALVVALALAMADHLILGALVCIAALYLIIHD